jgi:hypothetical protein
MRVRFSSCLLRAGGLRALRTPAFIADERAAGGTPPQVKPTE